MIAQSLFSIGGIAICGLLIVQLTAVAGRSFQSMVYARKQFQLTQQLLQAKITAAKRSLVFSEPPTTAWAGLRKFRVKWKILEANECHSFYLVPHDGKPLPPYRPGQYLTLSIKTTGSDRPLVRCYSLSESPRQDYYRITVKKIVSLDLPVGRVSGFLNDKIGEGDILDIKAPSGKFYLDTDSDVPVVFLAGGIGVTPLLSMANYLVDTQPTRRAYFFLGARNSHEHPFRDHLSRMAQEHANFTLHTRYSSPLSTDREYDSQGHVDIELLRQVLPTLRLKYYVCGPPAFLKSLSTELQSAGVPKELILSEAFGAESVKIKPKTNSAEFADKTYCVRFARSEKQVEWDANRGTLLDLADATGISIESGCRAGNCGTCVTAVKSGIVRHDDDVSPDEGTCLPCVGIPDGPVVLDA